nr:MAG TPA: hypothetical protein [Caudoviricetes sp.]
MILHIYSILNFCVGALSKKESNSLLKEKILLFLLKEQYSFY